MVATVQPSSSTTKQRSDLCVICNRLGATSFNLEVYSHVERRFVKVCPNCYHLVQEDDRRDKQSKIYKEWSLTARRIV